MTISSRKTSSTHHRSQKHKQLRLELILTARSIREKSIAIVKNAAFIEVGAIEHNQVHLERRMDAQKFTLHLEIWFSQDHDACNILFQRFLGHSNAVDQKRIHIVVVIHALFSTAATVTFKRFQWNSLFLSDRTETFRNASDFKHATLSHHKITISSNHVQPTFAQTCERIQAAELQRSRWGHFCRCAAKDRMTQYLISHVEQLLTFGTCYRHVFCCRSCDGRVWCQQAT